ncbi:MAG: hydroxyacylglutathione hydrolase [Cocleimonas sp.]
MSHIITVPAFSDNFIWLVCNKEHNKKCDEKKQKGVIVDPGDPTHLLPLLEKKNIEPIAVIITHFHYDHGNGLPALLERYPDLPIYGPASEFELLKNYPAYPPEYGPASNCFKTIKALAHPLSGNEKITFDEIGCSFQVVNIPGHTSGHIAYYDEENKRLFCGDTMFAGGCGRVFNGTMKKLHDSLQLIKQLPEDTLIYCAHEYTLDNLGFAKWVEPDNKAISARQEEDMALFDNDKATVPSLLSLELETNPFMRTHLPHVAERVAEATGKTLNNSTEVFEAMRIWKDSEYD